MFRDDVLFAGVVDAFAEYPFYPKKIAIQVVVVEKVT